MLAAAQVPTHPRLTAAIQTAPSATPNKSLSGFMRRLFGPVFGHAPAPTTPTGTTLEALITPNQRIPELELEVAELRGKKEVSATNIANLTTAQANQNANIAKLEDALKKLSLTTDEACKKKLSQGKINLTTLKEELSTITQQLKTEQTSLGAIEAQIQEKSKAIENLQRSTPQEQAPAPDLFSHKKLQPQEVNDLNASLNAANTAAAALQTAISNLSSQITILEIHPTSHPADIETGPEISSSDHDATQLQRLQSELKTKEGELKSQLKIIKTCQKRLFEHSFAMNPLAWKILSGLLKDPVASSILLFTPLLAVASGVTTKLLVQAHNAKILAKQASTPYYIDNPLTRAEAAGNEWGAAILFGVIGAIAGGGLGIPILLSIRELTKCGAMAKYYAEQTKPAQASSTAGADIEMAQVTSIPAPAAGDGASTSTQHLSH